MPQWNVNQRAPHIVYRFFNDIVFHHVSIPASYETKIFIFSLLSNNSSAETFVAQFTATKSKMLSRNHQRLFF